MTAPLSKSLSETGGKYLHKGPLLLLLYEVRLQEKNEVYVHRGVGLPQTQMENLLKEPAVDP